MSEALDRRETKMKEDLAANPAMSSSNHAQLTTPISSSHAINGKLRGKGRVTDEKDKAGSSRSRGDDKRSLEVSDDDHIVSTNLRSSSGRLIKASRAVREGTHGNHLGDTSRTNGVARPRDQEESWPDDVPSASPPQSSSQRSSYEFPPYAPGWPGQYTGPASGFLQDPPRTWMNVTQNPGRTIYTHHQRTENASYP